MGTDIHGSLQKRWRKEGPYETIGPIESSRNYRVFAALAGVRNGFGFAGCETHKAMTPISEPRGLPDGVSEDEEDYGDHSYSWLYLREVIDWKGWDMELQETGVVSLAEYKEMERDGLLVPKEWSSGVMGRDIVVVDESEVIPPNATHVQIKWKRPMRVACKTFVLWLEYLKSAHGWRLKNDPDALRLVFGFDS